MSRSGATTVLFTGYAPVHFLCFLPIYERLCGDRRFEVFCSGGLRTKDEESTTYDGHALYEPLGVPAEHILSIEEIQRRDFDLLIGANTKPICPRSAEAKIQIFHGISFRNVAIREEVLAWDYFFLAGPYMRRRFVESKLIAENDPRALNTGFPKTDRLVNGALNRAEILARHGFDGSRPLVLYAPTGQKHNSLETIGEEAIQRLAGCGEFDVLIKLHDHPKEEIDWCARLAPMEGPRVRLARHADVIPLLFAADLLITDASSVSSEYSLLDRPMVFLDVPKLISKSQQKNANLDLQTWGRRCGVLVENAEEIVPVVQSSLRDSDRLSRLRHEMAADLFYNPGRATETALQHVHRIVAEKIRSAARHEHQGVTSL
jgi:hypothetical protein